MYRIVNLFWSASITKILRHWLWLMLWQSVVKWQYCSIALHRGHHMYVPNVIKQVIYLPFVTLFIAKSNRIDAANKQNLQSSPPPSSWWASRIRLRRTIARLSVHICRWGHSLCTWRKKYTETNEMTTTFITDIRGKTFYPGNHRVAPCLQGIN